MSNALAGQKRAGLSATAIKYVAIIAMFFDHFANVFFPAYFQLPALALHLVGRITGPVMFYFIVEGYHHTKNANRYTLRLFVFAVLSYLPFLYYRQATGSAPAWYSMSVIYTLLLALLALRAVHEVQNPLLRAGCVVGSFLFSLIGDWSWMAILFVLLFDRYRYSFAAQAKAYSVVCLLLVATPVLDLLLAPGLAALDGLFWQNFRLAFVQQALPWMAYYAAFFLPLLLLRFYNGTRGGGGRWTFYIFYPAHLLFLGLAGTVFSLNF